MLRQFLLYLSTAAWARNIATRWGVAWRVASRFIAGETVDDAIATTKKLHAQGLRATVDYLGESVATAEDTKPVVATYLQVIERIAAENLPATVSVKLTHFGLDISETLCLENLRQVLTVAKQHNIPLTIDMESTAYTDTTLRIYRMMRDDEGFSNVGAVIQAYLYRSKADMEALAQENAIVRWCKGAYLEPASVAFPDKADVDKQYVDVMKSFLAADTNATLQLATHDEAIIETIAATVTANNTDKNRYEFQMLHGIRAAKQVELAQAGYPVRVYVPFGEAWYPYFMRRLAERPANVMFFAKALFKR